MPLYEYQCQACGHRLEVIQRLSDEPLRECPECGGELKKLISAPAVQFKGSGWYITDYARKTADKSGAKSGEAKESSKDSSSSGESSTGGAEKAASKTSESKTPAKAES